MTFGGIKTEVGFSLSKVKVNFYTECTEWNYSSALKSYSLLTFVLNSTVLLCIFDYQHSGVRDVEVSVYVLYKIISCIIQCEFKTKLYTNA